MHFNCSKSIKTSRPTHFLSSQLSKIKICRTTKMSLWDWSSGQLQAWECMLVQKVPSMSRIRRMAELEKIVESIPLYSEPFHAIWFLFHFKIVNRNSELNEILWHGQYGTHNGWLIIIIDKYISTFCVSFTHRKLLNLVKIGN